MSFLKEQNDVEKSIRIFRNSGEIATTPTTDYKSDGTWSNTDINRGQIAINIEDNRAWFRYNSGITEFITNNNINLYFISGITEEIGWFSVEATRNSIIYAPVDLLRGGVTTSDSPFVAPYKCKITEISVSSKNQATWTGFTEVFNPNDLVTPVWSYPIYVNNEMIKTIEFSNSFTIQKGYIIRMRIEQLIDYIRYPTMTIFFAKK